jgi:hypothetical protein
MDAARRSQGKKGADQATNNRSKEQLRAVALLPEVLIPIRLEYEHEAYKLRDTLTWNLRGSSCSPRSAVSPLSHAPLAETIVTPEIFASHLVEDLRLPYNAFYKEIVAQIKRHIEDAQLTENYAAHLGDDLAAVREDNQAWFETNAKKRIFEEDTQTGDTGGEDVLTLRDFSRQEGVNDELRVVIKVSPLVFLCVAFLGIDTLISRSSTSRSIRYSLSTSSNGISAILATLPKTLPIRSPPSWD